MRVAPISSGVVVPLQVSTRGQRQSGPIYPRFYTGGEITKMSTLGSDRKDEVSSPENYRDRIRTARRERNFLAGCQQSGGGSSVVGDGGNGSRVQIRWCLSGVVPMEHGFVWLEHSEYERCQAGDEELRDDDKDVVYALEGAERCDSEYFP